MDEFKVKFPFSVNAGFKIVIKMFKNSIPGEFPEKQFIYEVVQTKVLRK